MHPPNAVTPLTKRLDLINANVTNLDSLLHLRYLRALDLSHNQLKYVNLASLKYLEDLDVSHNQITSLNRCDFPLSIRRLSLGFNQIEQLDELTVLPCLTHINLQENRLTSVNSLALCCPGICEIDLSANLIADVSDLQQLSKCAMLFKLVLIRNPLTQQAHNDDPLHWLRRVVYMVPQLQIIQHLASVAHDISIESFVHSCTKHGDDDARRTKLTRFYRCRGDRTRLHHIDGTACVKWAGLVGVQCVRDDGISHTLSLDSESGVPVDLVRDDVRPFLTEPKFWTLMAEQGFVHEWIRVQRAIYSCALGATKRSEHIKLNLDGVHLGCVGLRSVAQALLNDSTRNAITEISLDGADDLERFVHRLSNLYGLKHLIKSIAISNVASLTLKHCSFGMAECEIVAQHFVTSSTCPVRHLDLSSNQIGQHQYLEGVQIRQCPGLSALFASRAVQQLVTLNLSHNGIDRQGATQIASWLLVCQAQTLVLDGNPLDDRSIELISQSLCHNSTLRYLSIADLPPTNKNGGVSIAALVSLTSCLATSNDTIQSINLSNNRQLCAASKEAPTLIAGHLVAQWLSRDARFRSTSCVLRTVDLANCGLISADICPLASAIRENHTLQSLKLSISDSSLVTSDQALSFLDAVSSSVLVSLNVHGLRCDISNPSLMRSLSMVCSRHPSLVELVIGPIVGPGSADCCGTLLPRSTSLTCIELLGHPQSCTQSLDRLLLEILQIRCLRRLTLRGHNMPSETIRVLTSMFSGFSCIGSLHLVDCCFPAAHALDSMFDSMLANRSLRHFSLERSPLSHNHWRDFLNVMQSRKSNWCSIRLSNCDLSYIDLCSARRLLSQPELAELDLTDNRFDVQSLLAISDSIPLMSKLRRCRFTSGHVPFHFDNKSLDLSQREWSTVARSLITRCHHMEELGLPHINVQNAHQNDQLVNDVLDAITKVLSDSRIHSVDTLQAFAFIMLPKSLSFNHTASRRLVKLLDVCPSLRMCTDTVRSLHLNWSGDMTSFEEDLSSNALSARLALGRLC